MNGVIKNFFICALLFFIIGHHGVQAQILDQHHAVEQEYHEACEGSECEHQQDLDICKKIEDEQVRVSDTSFVVPDFGGVKDFLNKSNCISLEVHQVLLQRLQISHQELARSHMERRGEDEGGY